MGKPVKIVEINKDGTLKFNKDVLQEILCEKGVKHKRICVLSVAGVFRGGKSLLLDFFLRYLQRGGTDDWLMSDDEKLDGFSWKGGCERVTTGIWVWNELYTLPLNPEVAIMLMDTQGLFDNETNMKGSVAIFSLSTIVSSIQIYNVSKKITSTDLDHLHYFTEYGRLVESEGSGKPFQNLVFLVRDWPNKQNYSYGEEGGSKYLESILKDKDDSELQAVRDHLKKKCFEKLNCFLMPHPGLKVEEENFSGQLRDIRQEFQDFLRKLVSMVLPLEGLVHKKNMGKDVTCQQLFSLIQNFVGVFETGELPLPRSLYQASAELSIREAYEKSLKTFCDQMEATFGGDQPYFEEIVLEMTFFLIALKTVIHFEQTRKMDMPRLIKTFETKLWIEMLSECEKYKKNNNHKKWWVSSILRRMLLPSNSTFILYRSFYMAFR